MSPRTRNRRTARSAGTRWESVIVEYLKGSGWPHARRRAKTGKFDQGDVTPGDGWPVTIEAKDVRTRAIAEWVAEAEIEAINAGLPVGVVWAKRAGKPSAGDGYVFMSGATFTKMLELVKPTL